MSYCNKLLIMSILILAISAKFSEKSDYSFLAWNSSTTLELIQITLSTDDDQLAVISQNLTASKFHQTVYNFDGSKVCDADYQSNIEYVSWPSKTNGLFHDYVNKTLLKASSVCGQPTFLANVSDPIKDASFTFTSKESYIALALRTNKIVEYNLGSGAVSREFNINSTSQIVGGVDYSPDHDYLWAPVASGDQFKAIVFDAQSGDRKRQILSNLSNLSFIKGNADGDAFLAADQNLNILYKVDKDGNTKEIWAPTGSTDIVEAPLAICTDDIKIIALRASGMDLIPKIQIVSYDSDDGSELQVFEINFLPDVKKTQCNDNYLSILDTTGRVHIFKYSRSLPAWAIVLIVVGSLAVIGGIVGFIIYKRKQNLKAEGYKQFSNEEKSRNGL